MAYVSQVLTKLVEFGSMLADFSCHFQSPKLLSSYDFVPTLTPAKVGLGLVAAKLFTIK